MTRFICCLSDDNPKVIELPVSLQNLDDWQKGRKEIGVAMPQLSAPEIDFLMHGLYSETLREIKDE